MNEISRTESKKRESGIKSFDKYWEIDYKEFEIKHIELKGCSYFFSLFWRKKHRVSDLYWWWVRTAAGTDGIFLSDALKHDDLPITGYLRKYQLTNNWHIPRKDLKYLFDGPLADTDGSILVKEGSLNTRLKSKASQIGPLTWLISVPLALYNSRHVIAKMLRFIVNAIFYQ